MVMMMMRMIEKWYGEKGTCQGDNEEQKVKDEGENGARIRTSNTHLAGAFHSLSAGAAVLYHTHVKPSATQCPNVTQGGDSERKPKETLLLTLCPAALVRSLGHLQEVIFCLMASIVSLSLF